jgi:predicted aconitase
MFLTKEEEKIYEGEYGEAKASMMRLLVAIGEVYGASKLIKPTNAHVSGVSYKTIGDVGLEFIEGLAKKNAKASIQSQLNPAGIDLKNWSKLNIPKDFAEKQIRIISAYEKIGIKALCTCTPYLIGISPRMSEHIAWAESSAVVFANSVLGARTNREAATTALASAIVGRTPFYGLHLKEQRHPTHLIDVEVDLLNELDFSLLGYRIGKDLRTGIPFIRGIKGKIKNDYLKALSASIAVSSSIAMFHIDGITPESNMEEEGNLKNLEKISITDYELKKVNEELSFTNEFDTVCIGCPHCSLNEIKYIAEMSRGKKFQKKLFIYTSRKVLELAKKMGYVNLIESAGGKMISDTCMVVSPLESLGIKSVLTNSCKAAYYISSLCKLKVKLTDLSQCIRYAIQ